MSFVRFLMLLSLVAWVGGIMFFAFVLAPTVFHPGILPSRQLAGAVVSRSLGILHWIGLACGLVFLVTSMIESQVTTGVAAPLAGRNLLVYAMIVLTLVSMFGISTRMLALRNDMVFIDNIPHDDAAQGGVQPFARVVHPAGKHSPAAGAGSHLPDVAAIIIESSRKYMVGACGATLAQPDSYSVPPHINGAETEVIIR